MIFMSRAAKFNFSRAVRHLTIRGRKSDYKALRKYLESRYDAKVVLFHNGRTAIAEGLKQYLNKGDAVAVNGLTCFAVRQSVLHDDNEVMYLDIDFETANYTPETLREAIKKNPQIKAIILQNMLGFTVDIRPFEQIAKQHKLIIVEDLAHCVGAHYADGREAGTVGNFAILSFGKGKVIDAMHGGALVLCDKKVAEQYDNNPTRIVSPLQRFRDRVYPIIGWFARKFYRVKIGPAVFALALKLKIVVRSVEGPVMPHITVTNWQARLALEQMKELDDDVKTRISRAHKLYGMLPENLQTYTITEGSAPLRYPILVPNRDEMLRILMKYGFYFDDTWYDVPVSPKRYYHKVNFPEKSCPNATRTAAEIINLPLHIDPSRITKAIKVIEDNYAQN